MCGMKRVKENLIPISVYVTPEEHEIITKLAILEDRSVSNLGKYLYMREARKVGLIDENQQIRRKYARED